METSQRPALCMSLTLIVLLSALPAAMSQDDARPAQTAAQQGRTQPHRPRIGLALSGGGALGLAEIGVIQWMEENHIPVDRVAGTSMGSIIGAMYATGMSPVQIRDFAQKIDWERAFLPGPAYGDLSFRRKQDGRESVSYTHLTLPTILRV